MIKVYFYIKVRIIDYKDLKIEVLSEWRVIKSSVFGIYRDSDVGDKRS